MKLLIAGCDDAYAARVRSAAYSVEAIDEVFCAADAGEIRTILFNRAIDIILVWIPDDRDERENLCRWLGEMEPEIRIIAAAADAGFEVCRCLIRIHAAWLLDRQDCDAEITRVIGQMALLSETGLKEGKRSKEQAALKEKFITAILLGKIPASEREIRSIAGNLGIQMPDSSCLHLLLFDTKKWDELLVRKPFIQIEKVLKDSIRNTLADKGIRGVITVPVSERYYVSLIRFLDAGKGEESVKRIGRTLQLVLEKETGSVWNCFYHGPCTLQETAEQVRYLSEMAKNEDATNGVFSEEMKETVLDEEHFMPFMGDIYDSILVGDSHGLDEAVEKLFTEIDNLHYYSYYQSEGLLRVYLKYMLSLLDVKGIRHSAVVSMPNYHRFRDQALAGPDALKKYIEMMNLHVAGLLYAAEDKASLTEQVRNYVDAHISEEISREDIARFTFLNEDYLSRIFSKEQGIPLSQYILTRRIERAKEFLRIPDMPISEVAEKSGMGSFAYFSRQFRNRTGMSPSEYRRSMNQERNRFSSNLGNERL